MKKNILTKSKLFLDDGNISTKDDITKFMEHNETYGYHLKKFKKITTHGEKKNWILVSLKKLEE